MEMHIQTQTETGAGDRTTHVPRHGEKWGDSSTGAQPEGDSDKRRDRRTTEKRWGATQRGALTQARAGVTQMERGRDVTGTE